MRRFFISPGKSRDVAAAAARAACLVLALSVMAPMAARADCFPISDPTYLALDPTVNKNATQTLSMVAGRLRTIERAGAPVDPKQLAAIYAVQADAYSALEFDHEARATALKGLALVTGPTDPLRLELLSTAALNIYTQDGIRDAITALEAARSRQPPDSMSNICLEIALGDLERRAGENALATRILTQAYHDTETPARDEAHSKAASALAAALRTVGDYPEALTLQRQRIAWDTTHGNSLSLSVSYYLEGAILEAMREYHPAIDTFQQSRSMSLALGDTQGVAFADMRICESLIELSQFQTARPSCDSAAQIFAASNTTDVLKEAQGLLAIIDLNEGRAKEALGILNGVLDHNGTDMAPKGVSIAYRTRARAYAAQRNYTLAYSNLEEFVRRDREENLARSMRMQETVKERAVADREIARNALLQRQLELTQQRETRQKETLRWVAIANTAGVLIIALLSYILYAYLRHRRQLMRLATEDNLTGIPNRGRTIELATAALESAVAHARALTVAIIDLDHFKAINDRCGHAAGDHVLREFARVGRGALRATDVLGRWGGEEFLLILPETTLDAALATVERLRVLALAIQLPTADKDPPLRITFSAGLATTADGARSLDEIIARADAALYEAKNEGRDLVRIDRESYRSASTGVRRALHLR